MTLVGEIRGHRLAGAARERAKAYASAADAHERRQLQLELLNREWQRAIIDVPYVSRLRAEHGLRTRFSSLEEFASTVPLTTRASIQQQGREMRSSTRAPDVVRMTGGSTGAPVQIPAWKSELVAGRPDMWLGRSWYGVTPASRLFLLWGHSHLLGTGIPGWLRARKREVQDALLGYHRFSAYDLRPEKLREAARAMRRFGPDYVVGYSVALDLFARANAEAASELRKLGVRVVIGTAESFPRGDSVEILHDLFGCPIAMEYGAVECGLIAHTHPDEDAYRVFWRTFLVEAVESDGRPRVVVTSLSPRCMPLIRYELGDEIEGAPGDGSSMVGLTAFKRVVGRCNDWVLLRDGSRIHSEVFSHAVRPCAQIHGFQVVQDAAGLRISFTATSELLPENAAAIRARLARVHPALGEVVFVRVPRLTQTVAGKTRLVVRETSPRG